MATNDGSRRQAGADGMARTTGVDERDRLGFDYDPHAAPAAEAGTLRVRDRRTRKMREVSSPEEFEAAGAGRARPSATTTGSSTTTNTGTTGTRAGGADKVDTK
jgi:hypothetical protein